MGRWRGRPSRAAPARPVRVAAPALPSPAPVARVLALCTALAVVAGCTVRIRPEPPPASRPVTAAPAAATTTTSAAATRGTTPALRAFTLVRAWAGGRVRPAPARALPLAMRRRAGPYADEMVTLLLVFPLLRTQPRCVRHVELWLRVLRFDQQFRYQDPQIAAYPSLLVSLASARPVTRAGFETLIDNRPTGDGVRTPDEDWLHFDITELYRTWAEGGPFPSQLRPVRKGTPLVVDVRATDFGQQLFEARMAPVGDREAAPHLRWTAARDCSSAG
jgi:hypothetical protein